MSSAVCSYAQSPPAAGTGAVERGSNSRNRPTRSRPLRVVSRGGIVATSQTLASQAGAAILDRGGSAIDAAIAANAVLGVTEPVTNGIGGDLLAIVYDAKTKNSTG